MQVVDASVVIEALQPDRPLTRVAAATLQADCVAPELLDLEVVQVFRRLLWIGEISPGAGDLAVGGLMRLPLVRRSLRPFLPRVWELQDNLTAYDATYVALAEALGCPLVTADSRLAGAAGIRCEIVVLAA